MIFVIVTAAFAIGEWVEALVIAAFFAVGEFAQHKAVEKSRSNIVKLMDIRPDYANRKTENGIEKIDPKEIKIGDIIVVRAGEKIPLDGVVVFGSSFLNTAAITGESTPRSVNVGDEILSGTINNESILEIRVTKEYGQSTVAKILELVEHAREQKSKSENFITKFARVFTPLIMVIAVLVAVLPPLLGFGTYQEWIYRAVCFVAVSCPCALVMSIPLSVFGGIGGCARNGILVKGGNYLEMLNAVKVIAFDKTGTLTHGDFVVCRVVTNGVTEGEIVELAAAAEQHSAHPIAKSILAHFGKPVTQNAEITEKAGMGIIAKIRGETIYVGNRKLLETVGLEGLEEFAETAVYVARGKKYLGCILISDKVKENAKAAIQNLARCGVQKTVMLTGDNEITAAAVARDLGIGEYYANLLPQDKVAVFEKIKAQSTDKIAFVGDGMNDAPVLSRADVGIAVVNETGVDAAIETADVVLLNGDPNKVFTAKKIARKTKRVIIQNITLALGVKFSVMALAFFGFAHIWLAIFADVGVALLSILNAARCLKI
jgi:Cd2+/Zn2+-exporting ATPase